MAEQTRKILYHSGLVTVSELTQEDIVEFRKLRCGVSQTVDRIRSVAVDPEEGIVQILDKTCNGLEKSRINVVNRGHLDYLYGKNTKRAREYESKYCGAGA